MIKVVSGFTGPGGSTVVFNTLVNLFNKNGLPACLYGPSKWEGISCEFKPIEQLTFDPKDTIIQHFLTFPAKPNVRRLILSCHETSLFRIKDIKNLSVDKIHFVSEFQKNWQGVEGVVIPNPIREFTKIANKTARVAGIIGSIDRNKRVGESIQKAIKDGFEDIRLYGGLSDYPYFLTGVLPLLSDKVTYRGVSDDMDKTYQQLSHVYHSPLLETFNLIKPECEAAGVTYVGNEGNDTKAEIWPKERILEAWKALIG